MSTCKSCPQCAHNTKKPVESLLASLPPAQLLPVMKENPDVSLLPKYILTLKDIPITYIGEAPQLKTSPKPEVHIDPNNVEFQGMQEAVGLAYLIGGKALTLKNTNVFVRTTIDRKTKKTSIMIREKARGFKSKHTINIDADHPTPEQTKLLRDLLFILYSEDKFAIYQKYIDCGCGFLKSISEGNAYINQYYDPLTDLKKSFKLRHEKAINRLISAGSVTLAILMELL